MSVQSKQIKKLNVQNFLTFLTDASTKNAQHVIDIKDGKIYTKITNDGKEFVKFASTTFEYVGGDWSDFKDGAYRFYMTDMDKIIKAFEIAKAYNKETVNVKLACNPIENEDYTRIERFWLEGQLKLQVSGKDGSYNFNYTTDEKWNNIINAPTVAEYDLDESDINGLRKIFSYLTGEDIKNQKDQGLHIHLIKDNEGKDIIKFTEEDEKVFTLMHNKNIVFTNPEATHLSHHAYLLHLFDEKFYRVHIKLYGEVYVLVAKPTDSAKIIALPLFNFTPIPK